MVGIVRKAVKDFEGLYEVDEEGHVFSLKNNIELKAYNNGYGYWKVNLYKNHKCIKKYVHRLVAEAFIPNPDSLKEVNHINCDKRDCCVSNLEWCDRHYNLQHSYKHGLKRTCENHGSAKLNWKAVNDIRTKQLSQKEYAIKYEVRQCTISAIQHNKLWKVGDVDVMCETL